MSKDLLHGLADLRKEVLDLAKAKRDKDMENDAAAQWLAQHSAKSQAPKSSEPQLSHADYLARGHSPEEADVMTGKWRPKLGDAPRGRLEDLTPAMLAALKPYAAKHVANYEKMAAANADPEFNPIKSAHGKLLASADKAYSPLESAKKQFMESDAYKNLSDEFDREDALNDFTHKWLKDPKNKDKSAGIHSLADIASEKQANLAASMQRRAEQLQDIASGGPQVADMTASHQSTWHDDGDSDIRSAYEDEMQSKTGAGMTAQAASQHLGLSGKQDEGDTATTGQHAASSFASSNPEFVEQKVKPAAERLSAAAASKKASWQRYLASKNPDAIERKNAIDTHKNKLNPTQSPKKG